MPGEILERAVYDQEGRRRLAIYRRRDGCYFYVEEALCDLDKNLGITDAIFWEPVHTPGSSGIYDSPETALREASIEVSWVRERLQDGSQHPN